MTYPGAFDVDGNGQSDTVDQAWLASTLAPVDAFITTSGLPVAVNEYGVQRWEPGAAQYMADQMALFEARGLNHAWWLWGPSDERFVDYTHYFNPLLGPDPANRGEVETSDLLEVIRQNWSLNALNPPGTATPSLFLPLIVR